MLLLVVLCLGLRASCCQYPLSTDGQDPHATVDEILEAVNGDSLSGSSPDFALDWQLEDGPEGRLVSEDGLFRCSGMSRVGGVRTTYQNGNLTIHTTATFKDLRAKHSLQVEEPFRARQIVLFTSPTNRFVLKFTIFSNPKTDQCDVALGESSFVGGALRVRLRPTGFFNQLDLTATLNHLKDNFLPRLFDVSKEKLRAALREAVCNKISDYDGDQHSRQQLIYSNEELNESWEVVESGQGSKSTEPTVSWDVSGSIRSGIHTTYPK